MYSLNTLGYISQRTIDVTDLRPAGAKFNRVSPLKPVDQVLNINSTSVVISPGIEIKEVVNYNLANVRYRIKINTSGDTLLTGSSLTWAGGYPSNIAISNLGNEYIVYGITSPSDWQYVRSFVWNLPSNYADYPCWFLTASIEYYDETISADRSIEWFVYDPRFFYVSQMNATSEMSVVAVRPKEFNVNATAIFDIVPNLIKAVSFSADLVAESSIFADGYVNPINMYATTSLSAGFTGTFRGVAPLVTETGMISSGIRPLRNVVQRTYTVNNGTRPFITNPLIIDEVTSSTGKYQYEFTTSLGKWGYNGVLYNNTLTLQGTKDELNDLSNVYFYPDLNQSSNGTLNIKLYNLKTVSGNLVVDQLIIDKTVEFNSIAGSYNGTRTLNYTSAGTYTFVPTLDDVMYGKFGGIIMLGAGGAASSTAGGGGGGYTTWTNLDISNITYSISVGSGCLPGQEVVSGFPGTGGQSTMTLPGITQNWASGGSGGRGSGNYSPLNDGGDCPGGYDNGVLHSGYAGGTGIYSGGGGTAAVGTSDSTYPGGLGGSANTPYLYNPSTGTFSRTSSYGHGGSGSGTNSPTGNTYNGSGGTITINSGRSGDGYVKVWIVAK